MTSKQPANYIKLYIIFFVFLLTVMGKAELTVMGKAKPHKEILYKEALATILLGQGDPKMSAKLCTPHFLD